MFDTKHYVPILKWKAAEQQALKNLGTQAKNVTTPVVQLVMPTPQKNKKDGTPKEPSELIAESVSMFRGRLPGIGTKIKECWGDSPIFIDVNLVIDSSLKTEAFAMVLSSGSEQGCFLIPVISLKYDSDLQSLAISLAKKFRTGVCLRLNRRDFSDEENLAEKIQDFLNRYSLKETEVDLLVDFLVADPTPPDFKMIIAKIPNLNRWRTFTFASGAFPVDLTKFRVDEENRESRLDWKNWSSSVVSGGAFRMPSFGDYTIQHPIYKEGLSFFTPSASVRYTLPEEWLIMRGNKGKHQHYIAHAKILVGRKEFFGKNFSFGDNFIFEKSLQKIPAKNPGNATNWLVAGINHHLECTAHQIASLT